MAVGPTGTIPGRTWRNWSRRQYGVLGCLALLGLCVLLAIAIAIATGDDDEAVDEALRPARIALTAAIEQSPDHASSMLRAA